MPPHCILIAKTCIDCGRLLDAKRFWRNGKRTYHRAECKRCSRGRVDKPPIKASRITASGILLAKTCVDCGDFLMAEKFWRNGKPGRWHACNRCMKHRVNRQVQIRRHRQKLRQAA
jgi:hypothetical protein